MPRWTYKPIWAQGQGHTIIDDRSIYRDGVRVGRVYVERYGPQQGIFQWFGMWAGNDNSGRRGTLEEALEAIRLRAPADSHIYYKRKEVTAHRRKLSAGR